MFKVSANLTGVRAPKTTDAELSTTSTPGSFRLNANAAEKLKVQAGDHVRVIVGEDENGTEQFAIHKADSTEAGTAKVAFSNGKNSGSLVFSSSNAYARLGGSSDILKVYLLGDGEVGQEGDNNTYFPLTPSTDRSKMERPEVTEEQKAERKEKRAATLAAKKTAKADA